MKVLHNVYKHVLLHVLNTCICACGRVCAWALPALHIRKSLQCTGIGHRAQLTVPAGKETIQTMREWKQQLQLYEKEEGKRRGRKGESEGGRERGRDGEGKNEGGEGGVFQQHTSNT